MTPRKPAQTPARAIKTPRRGQDTRPAPISWQTAYCEATRIGWLFVLPVPMSANKSHRRGRFRQYTPEQHRSDKAQAAVRFGSAAQLTGDVAVRIGWVRERKSGDTDNRKKTTLDILKGVAYADDKQVADARIVRFDDPTMAPGVYVWVEPWQPIRLQDLAA
jgi:Holliday junction resolvase RusA-like endonuclease